MPLARALTGVSILIVEDDEDTRELYRLSLTGAGAWVQTASDAESALETLATVRPDVVLCDLHLPGVDGYMLLESVLANPRLVDLPIISISGSHPTVERERALHAGFVRHLSKPSRLLDIVSAVASVVALQSMVASEQAAV